MDTSNNNNNNNQHGKHKPDGSFKPKLVGAIAELGSAVFTIGEKNSLTNYDIVKKKIAIYVGSQIDSSMYDLVYYGIEKTYKKPDRPKTKPVTRSDTTKEGDDEAAIMPQVDPYEMKEFDKEYESYIREKKGYQKWKGRCFVIIMGQCTLALSNKLEGDKISYLKLRSNDDVTGLLDKIEVHLASPSNSEYEIATMAQCLLTYINHSQFPNETFTSYKTRLETVFNMSYTYADITPIKLPATVTEEQFKEAFKAFILLKGGHSLYFADLKERLHGYHSGNVGSYPITFDGMASLMSDHYDLKTKKTKPPKGERDTTPKRNNLQASQVDSETSSTQQAGESATRLGPPRRSDRPSRGAFQS